MIDVRQIMELLPHRYPFLLVDRIVELEVEKTARGIKNVTIGEPFFQGHFPGHPIMPGVLIIEAMAQVGGILAFKSTGTNNKLVYFMGIDKARFRRPVVPGDTLDIRVEVVKHRGEIWVLKGTASVGGSAAAEAELMAKVVER